MPDSIAHNYFLLYNYILRNYVWIYIVICAPLLKKDVTFWQLLMINTIYLNRLNVRIDAYNSVM